VKILVQTKNFYSLFNRISSRVRTAALAGNIPAITDNSKEKAHTKTTSMLLTRIGKSATI
jgi:hypothetical protein